MSLLPRTADEFSSAEYWERFFKKRGEKAFEWYGDYNKLCGVLHKYIKVQDKVGYLVKQDMKRTLNSHYYTFQYCIQDLC